MLEIHGINETIAYCEALGIGRCFAAYANAAPGEYIVQVGFNENSGYTYIALENGITICSMMGNRIEYLVTDFETGKEYFYNTYYDAINSQINS